ncbi:MAG: hypothetical protein H6737_20500 [Alphaproteobacteria bacterium]|nr:hypothetical protein [Alphaproteobacteria bacterium]
MYRTLLVLIALAGCGSEEGPVRADGDERARVGVPDRNGPREHPLGRHRPAGRTTPTVRTVLGGQEGEPVWTGGDALTGVDDPDSDGIPGPPPASGDTSDTSDTGLP